MARVEYISPSEAWTPDWPTICSFRSASFFPCRLHGPTRLVRLLSLAGVAPEGQAYAGNRTDGSFWFPEAEFRAVQSGAMADLASQSNGSSDPGRSRDRLRAYLRLQFRDLLAVRRDWTPSFDQYAVLVIPEGMSAIVLLGKVAPQPVYNPASNAGRVANSEGVVLGGGLTQFAIHFGFPANRGLTRKIIGPFSF